MGHRIELLVLLAALLACGSAGYDDLRARAAFDFDCAEDKLHLRRAGEDAMGVQGCGQRATYMELCDGPANSLARDCKWVMNNSLEREEPPAQRRASPNPPRPTPPPEPELKAPPKHVVGFEFHAEREAVEAICTTGGGDWSVSTDTAFGCSRTPQDIGVPARATLHFCSDRLCKVVVWLESSPTEWILHFDDTRQSLNRTYGDGRLRIPISGKCRAAPEGCAQTTMRGLVEWTWKSGTRIMLRARALGSDAPPSVSIEYQVPSTRIQGL